MDNQVSTDTTEVGQRISELLSQLGGHADPAVAEAGEEISALLMEMYGAGLERIVALLADAGTPGAELLTQLADDDLVAGLLVLHDLHPEDTEARVDRALASVRPYLGSHAGDVELVGVEHEDPDGPVVRLALKGSCDGCPSSAVTVTTAIEKAIQELCPEIARVAVDGMADPAASGEAGLPPGAVALPLAAVGSAGASAAGSTPAAEGPVGWVALDPPELHPGQCATLDVAGHPVLLALPDDPEASPEDNSGGMVAYRDHCPACQSELDGAPLTGERLTCPSCSTEYDVRHAGRACDPPPDGPALHLEPLPLVHRSVGWRLALPRTPAGTTS